MDKDDSFNAGKVAQQILSLFNQNPKERMDVYKELRLSNKVLKELRSNDNISHVYANNGDAVFDLSIPIENLEILNDGSIGLIKEEEKPKVFLSYSSEDKRTVRYIAKKLKNSKIDYWLDEAELLPGVSLIEKIREAIDEVDVVLAILSKNSVESEWVKKELDIAMNQEIESKMIKIIPILIDEVNIPGFLVGKFYVDFRPKKNRYISFTLLSQSIFKIFKDRN